VQGGRDFNDAKTPHSERESVEAYDPETEAVVINSREEGIYVLIVGQGRTQTLGEILWAKTT
jgi:hypothetical protein